MFLFNMLVIPIITMRSFSEERKNKTDQALLTAPVGTYAIAFGKFLAALLVFAVSLIGSLIPAFVIGIFSSPNWAIIFGNILGTLFYGAAMIAISMFLSSLTENQIVAAISSMGVAVFLMVIDQIGSIVSNSVVTQIINWISFNTRYKTFTSGVFDLSSLVFFLSVAAAFLFLTARRLEGRRWN
jgi:ABC-2 type transport system permease protein